LENVRAPEAVKNTAFLQNILVFPQAFLNTFLHENVRETNSYRNVADLPVILTFSR
jgi:hypothetical protein